MIYISYQLVIKPLCFYLLHPSLHRLPRRTLGQFEQVLQNWHIVCGKKDSQTVPLLQVDRCKGRVREQFSCPEVRLHFLAGIRCEVEDEAEGQGAVQLSRGQATFPGRNTV